MPIEDPPRDERATPDPHGSTLDGSAPASFRLSAPAAVMIAWCGLAIVNAIAIAILIPIPAGRVGLRVVHHFYDAGQMIAIALASAGAVAAWEKWGPRRAPWAYAVLTVISTAAAFGLLGEDLSGFVQQQEEGGLPPNVLITILTVGVALSVPLAALAGRLLRRALWLRVSGITTAIILTSQNHWFYPNDYPGAHLYAALISAALAASALVGLSPKEFHFRRKPPAPVTESAPAPARKSITEWALPAALALWGALTTAAPIKNSVQLELLKSGGAPIAPFIARVSARANPRSTNIPEALRPWFIDRSTLPPIPPSSPPILSNDPIVIFLSIDAVRADLLETDKYIKSVRNLLMLKRIGVEFTHARAPGSQTVYSITSLMMGKYFSEQYWTPLGEPQRRHFWPHEDPSPRLPSLLAAAGIQTVTYGAAYWMTDSFGVVRGFAEDRPLATGRKYAMAADMMSAAIDRITHHKGGPLFLFMHLLDPHAPYDRGPAKGTPFERYLGEVSTVDEQILRLRKEITKAGLLQRTTLIIAADHGEAFGEHETLYHATTLYDELLRVPMIIVAPGVRARRVDDLVSTMDLGPTILDLMGVPTPGYFMGQSLVPYLRGDSPVLTRPIVAEGRLKRVMIFPDQVKVIADERRGTTEVYDLRVDPKEELNIYEEGSMAEERAALLRTFFDAHTLKRPGYVIPYRR